MKKKLGIGLLGCSVILRNAHGPAMFSLPEDYELIAMCDIDPRRLDQMADGYHPKRRYTALPDLLADPEVDVILNTTPTSEHAATTIACLKAGKHVLCEKPISVTMEDADAMVEAARQSGLVLQMALQSRHNLAWKKIHELLQGDAIGIPHTITVTQYWNEPTIYDNWRTTASVSGGGILADSCVHWIDMMRWQMGEITSVCGIGIPAPDSPLPQIEDTSLTLLRFASGAIGCLRNGWRNQTLSGNAESVEINGTKGSIRAELRTPWSNSGVQEIHLINNGDDEHVFTYHSPHLRFRDQLKDFAECVRGEHPVTCTVEDGRRALKIQQAIYASFESRRWEDVP